MSQEKLISRFLSFAFILFAVLAGSAHAQTLSLACTFPNGLVNTAYSANCTASGGSGTYTFSNTGSLPTNLQFATSGSTYTLSGMPSAAGTFMFTVTVQDTSTPQQTQSQQFTVVIATPLLLTCTLPNTGTVGTAYTGNCTASGGSGTYTFSNTGTPPTNLQFATSGSTYTLSGMPSATGTFQFTVTVQDTSTPQQTQSQQFTVVIAAAANPLSLVCSNLPTTGTVNTAYSGYCTASGGSGSYTFSNTGSLPTSLQFAASGATYTLSGMPSAAASFQFTVMVQDTSTPQQTQSQQFTVVISNPPLLLTCTNLPITATVNTTYSGYCTASGGSGSYTFSNSGSVPTSLQFAASSANYTLSGNPSAQGPFTFTVTVQDTSTPQQTKSQQITITVAPALLTISCTLPTTAEYGEPYTGASCMGGGGTPTYTYSVSSGSLPTGLQIVSTTGAITGSPMASGNFSFVLTVKDGGSPQQVANYPVTNFSVASQLMLTCTTPTQANIVGQSYTANCTASGGTPNYNYTFTGSLPGGLTLSSSNGAITGQLNASGTFNFTVKVTDGGSPAQSASQSVTITVVTALSITTTSFASGFAGQQGYSASCSATGGTPPYNFALNGGSLPNGLQLATGSSCAITGSPTTVGTFNFGIKVTDGGSPAQTYTQPLSITIGPALAITSTSAPNGAVNLAYSYALTAQYGQQPYSWSLASGTLPPGIGINGTSLSGTPTTANTYSFTLKVADSGSPSQSATQAYSVTIAAGLIISTTSLPNGVMNDSYTATLTAQNGSGTYMWSTTGGLPTGLSLSSSGTISGIPSAAGTFTFPVKVTDTTSPTPQTYSESFTVKIASTLTLTASTLPSGAVGAPYSTSCSASGGTTPLSYAVVGTLPAGLNFNTSNCAIAGSPTATGTSSFSITVTDASTPQQSATRQFSITVAAGLTITSGSLGAATQSSPYSGILTAANGTQPYTWQWSAASGLPAGLSFSSSGTISGTPTAPGDYVIVFTVTDSSSPKQTNSKTLTLVVNAYTAPVVPTFTFVGLPSSVTPGSAIGNLSVSASPQSSAAWPFSVTLTFTPNAAGVTSVYVDPALQFVNSSGTATGTSNTYTLSANTGSIALSQVDPGTVAGQIEFTLAVTGQTGTSGSVTVPLSVPIIESVNVLNVTSAGFDVEVIANSSPRDLETANFTFGASSGNTINGTTSFSVDVSSAMSSWYTSSTSQQYGSRFALTVPFTFSGSSSAIGTVSVTLKNSQGTSTASSSGF